VWDGKQIVESVPGQATVAITQLLYFEHFEEALSFIDFQAAIPVAKTKAKALEVYRKFYTPEDEEEFGIVAIIFSLV
jgi:ASC-1-like (ASCH) protein